jgi:hypothetical protein
MRRRQTFHFSPPLLRFAAPDRGDNLTIEACQRIIDDDLGGNLPAQSDLNAILGFLDAHSR